MLCFILNNFPPLFEASQGISDDFSLSFCFFYCYVMKYAFSTFHDYYDIKINHQNMNF